MGAVSCARCEKGKRFRTKDQKNTYFSLRFFSLSLLPLLLLLPSSLSHFHTTLSLLSSQSLSLSLSIRRSLSLTAFCFMTMQSEVRKAQAPQIESDSGGWQAEGGLRSLGGKR